MPVVLGGGRPYFGDLSPGDVPLGDATTCIPSELVIHLVYPVQRCPSRGGAVAADARAVAARDSTEDAVAFEAASPLQILIRSGSRAGMRRPPGVMGVPPQRSGAADLAWHRERIAGIVRSKVGPYASRFSARVLSQPRRRVLRTLRGGCQARMRDAQLPACTSRHARWMGLSRLSALAPALAKIRSTALTANLLAST